MPIFIRVLTPDGSLHPVDYEASSLADAGRYEPDDGVYTITNTFEITKALKLDAHFDRLEDSARRAGITLGLTRSLIRAALRRCILDFNAGNVRWRVTIGAAAPDKAIISLEPFTPLTTEFILRGVRVISAPNAARHNAAAKTTGWMHAREALIAAQPPGIYDTILQDADGHLLEGLGANFYAIREGTLYTAPVGMVLGGISRQIVFEVGQRIIPIVEAPVKADEVASLDEAFISSASRGIVPVIEIDGHALGAGRPGVWTLRLRDAYQAWVGAHLEEI
ncbi:MAG: aminotransferase class IV [Phototrophicaceae bacterium]|nr:aminotransferase class IV [Chloroflexota bacterium]